MRGPYNLQPSSSWLRLFFAAATLAAALLFGLPLGGSIGIPTASGSETGDLESRTFDSGQNAPLFTRYPDLARGPQPDNIVKDPDRKYLLQFDIEHPAGKQVESATLRFYVYRQEAPATIKLYTLLREWDELTASWNSPWEDPGVGSQDKQLLTTFPIQPGVNITGTSSAQTGWVEIDITPAVRAWHGGRPNNGLLFESEALTNTQIFGFTTNYTRPEPELRVTYSDEPPPPDPPQVDLTQEQVVLSAIQDAHLYDRYPNLARGSYPENPIDRNRKYLLQFGRPQVENLVDIERATLSFYVYQQSAPATVSLYRVFTPWLASTVTWNSPWSLPGGTGATDRELIDEYPVDTNSSAEGIQLGSGWVTFDVTDYLRRQLTESGVSQGFLFEAGLGDRTGEQTRIFGNSYSGKSPRLEITALVPDDSQPGDGDGGDDPPDEGDNPPGDPPGDDQPPEGGDSDWPSIGFATVKLEAYGDSENGLPVTFGQPFVRGDVPAGSTVSMVDSNGATVPLQVDPKNSYSDGSLRYAILTARPPQGAGYFGLVAIPIGPAGELPLAGASLPGGFNATVTFREDGGDQVVDTVSAVETLRECGEDLNPDGNPSRFLSGPEVVEIHTHTCSAVAGNPHLEVRFYMRLYSDGRVETDAVIENSRLLVAEPKASTLDVTARIGDREVTVTRTHPHHARWHYKGWFNGGGQPDPQLHVRHDRQYLIDTGAVPNYMNLPPRPDHNGENDPLDSLVQQGGPDTGPLYNGPHTDYMPAQGAQDGIGILPRWDAFAITSAEDFRAASAVQAGVDGAGAYTVHYRDETTGMPLSISRYPDLTLNGNGRLVPQPPADNNPNDDYNPREKNGYSADVPHQPSMGYLDYLLDGDFYSLEENHFYTTWNWLSLNPGYYGYGRNRSLHSSPPHIEVRHQAWALRTLAQAVWITPETPDFELLREDFNANLTNILSHYRAAYPDLGRDDPNAPKANSLGLLQSLNNLNTGVPWQDDFFTQVVGYIDQDLDFDASAIAEYKYKAVVGRLGVGDPDHPDQYCYKLAPAYTLTVFDPNSEYGNDYRHYFDSWGEVYRRSYPGPSQNPCLVPSMIDNGNPNDASSYVGNLQPAAAYAAAPGAPGAGEAYARLTSATNYPPDGNLKTFMHHPQWAIEPRSTGGDEERPDGGDETPPQDDAGPGVSDGSSGSSSATDATSATEKTTATQSTAVAGPIFGGGNPTVLLKLSAPKIVKGKSVRVVIRSSGAVRAKLRVWAKSRTSELEAQQPKIVSIAEKVVSFTRKGKRVVQLALNRHGRKLLKVTSRDMGVPVRVQVNQY